MTAHAFSGLVYRQIIEMLQGVRNEPDTRALIVQENMRYAKRQLTWFRHEPDVTWIDSSRTANREAREGREEESLEGLLESLALRSLRASR